MSGREFRPGDRVRVKAIGDEPAYNGEVVGEPTSFGNYSVSGRERGGTEWLPAYMLTLIEPEPAPVEPTDEQRAAVEWLRGITSDAFPKAEASHAQTLLAALPDALTNPQPTLPTEPGLYVDSRGVGGAVWRVENNGDMHREGGQDEPLRSLAPFTRLTPERPPVTMADLTRVYAEQTGARGVPIRLARALLKLANGTPDE